MKDIKDYLHLYLGCKVEIGATLPGMLLGVEGNTAFVKHFTEGRICMALKQVKPILRPLSDMTEEEGVEAEVAWKEGSNYGETIGQGLNCAYAYRLKYLLSKGFDLFNLIPKGLAIDKSSLPTKTTSKQENKK